MPAKDHILQINNLHVSFSAGEAGVEAVRGISFHLQKGETLGIVGESGSGKSVTALSVLGLLPENGNVLTGEISFRTKSGGQMDLAKLSQPQLQKIRGREIAMIFQEPSTSLNPVFSCGEQVEEGIRNTEYGMRNLRQSEMKKRVLELFEKVKLQDPERIYNSFPHQLSGGQLQRVMIAMALSANPSLLIADEPASALDVTVQRSILELLNELKSEWGGSTIFISHDLGVIAEVADRVLVMRKGEIAEEGRVDAVFKSPQHPYTQELLRNSRQLKSGENKPPQSLITTHRSPVLSINNLKTWFASRRNFFSKPTAFVKAVDEVSLEVFPGETLGVVGESGSGKTTLGRSILFLEKPSAGEVFYQQRNLAFVADGEWKALRKDLQIIFQDPYSSLNPRLPIGLALTEPMAVHGILATEKERRERAIQLLETVGLEAGHFWRYPDEFSGGQRQRICIARVLALEPKFIVCDECVSSLDVTVQAQILELLKKLQREHGLTYIFISHDLSVVRWMSDRIAVMKDGKIIEIGAAEEVYLHPKSEYARQLLSAIPGKI